MDADSVLIQNLVDEMLIGLYKLSIGDNPDAMLYHEFCCNLDENVGIDQMFISYALGKGLDPNLIAEIQSCDVADAIESNILTGKIN